MRPTPDVRDSQSIQRVPRADAIMSTRFVRVRPETPLAEVARLLIRHTATAAAVEDADRRFLGFVSAQGMLGAFLQFLHDEVPAGPAGRHLDPETPVLREYTPLLDVLEAFAGDGRAFQALPVLRDGGLVGVVTRLDALRAALDYSGGGRDLAPATLYISALKDESEKPPY